MFSYGYGFVVDYLAEILRSLRNHDFSDRYEPHFSLNADISTRDRTGINKTFSGLMKILYPDGDATEQEMQEILELAIEGRKRIKDQLMRIDPTYADVTLSYEDSGGQSHAVTTLEEAQYPKHYHRDSPASADDGVATDMPDPASGGEPEPAAGERAEKHFVIQENRRGIMYESLFGAYLAGARQITITDPFVRMFYQARNLMKLLETIARLKPEDEAVSVHLITTEDDYGSEKQRANLESIAQSGSMVDINFTWEFDADRTIHARHLVIDHGWKISLDRGLDIFQQYDMNDQFAFANRLQQFRSCKAFEVTILRLSAT